MDRQTPALIEVQSSRLPRWVGSFLDEHAAAGGAPTWSTTGEQDVVVTAADGAAARLRALDPAGAEQVRSLRTLVGWPTTPDVVAVLLVRRGGYAVGVVEAGRLTRHSCGTRYVQSRTAAGGWSQQRYARRRDNQAAALVDRAVDHLVKQLTGLGHPGALVVGGDRQLVADALGDRRLTHLSALPRREVYDIGDPRLEVLKETVDRALAVQVLLAGSATGTSADPSITPSTTPPQEGTMTASITAIEQLRPAAEAFTALVDPLTSSTDPRLERATPCEDWTVRELVTHLVREHLWVPALLAGETIEQVGDRFDGDVLGDDPAAAWHAAIEASLSAWSAVDPDREVDLSSGPTAAREYAEQMLTDLVVHAWDLARGLGIRPTLPPAAVDATLAIVGPMVSPRGMPGIFEPPVSTGSSDRVDQLVALTGRDPTWS